MTIHKKWKEKVTSRAKVIRKRIIRSPDSETQIFEVLVALKVRAATIELNLTVNR